MTIPKTIRSTIKHRLWDIADQLEWNSLGQSDKARYYEVWTKDPDIGGRLTRYMDGRQVRVYIKDSVLKDYGRAKFADPQKPLRALGLDANTTFAEKYIKPHGRRLADGRVICWGRADDWKAILMATHERAYIDKGRPYGVALLYAVGRYHELPARAVVEDAAKKLGITHVKWLD